MLDLLDIAVKHWSLALADRPRIGPTGLVCAVRWRGRPAVLKIPLGDEIHGADLLRAWAGRRAARVLDRLGSMHLLEKLEPGASLSNDSRGRDGLESLALLAETASDLFGADASRAAVPDATRWGELLLSGDRPEACGPDLWTNARDVYADLASCQGPTSLLHGDLHHGNLLWDRDRGWIAIDPKGVVAEAAFDLGSALRNPIDAIAVITRPDVVAARLDLLTHHFGHDRRRVAGWTFAQAVLSAAWSVEDCEDPSPSLAVARAYRPFIGS